jgi:hypothetical protein
VEALFIWLESTRLSQALRASPWLYPCIEIIHILGFTLLVGAIALFDVRLLGASRRLPVTLLGRHLRRGSLTGAVLAMPSGVLLFSANPSELANNPLFGVKLSCIALGALNALIFHRLVYRSVASWDLRAPTPRLARWHAALSLGIWTATIACGRMLAYV